MSRPMRFRCQRCGADIVVYDDTDKVTCEGCQADNIVERKQGTIALRIRAKSKKTTKIAKKVAGGLSLGQLTKQLVELRQESSTVRTRKIALATAGGICGTVLGYLGSVSSIEKDFGLGVAMLLCAAVALWFVRFVIRDSSASASRIDEEIEEIEIQIAEKQMLDLRQLAASKHGLD